MLNVQKTGFSGRPGATRSPGVPFLSRACRLVAWRPLAAAAGAAEAPDSDSDDQDAPEMPPALGPRTWMPMGAPVQLLKTTKNNPNEPKCMVVAHVALPVGRAPASLRMTLLTLNMTTLLSRSTPQGWETLQSLLPRVARALLSCCKSWMQMRTRSTFGRNMTPPQASMSLCIMLLHSR